jgi:hypothetical protein
MLAGSMLAGLMMDLFHLRVAFPLGAALMVLGTTLFLFCNTRRQVQKPILTSEMLQKTPYNTYDESVGFHPVSQKKSDIH